MAAPRRPRSQARLGWLLTAFVVIGCWFGMVDTARAEQASGATLFSNHCAGCHVNGGNILRRGKTLKLDALKRQGIDNEAAIALIAAKGVGQMSGYGKVLGDEGVNAVARWVWQQAQAGWPRS